MNKIAIYPGTFDPITNGHINIIEKAGKLFDKVIVAVAYHTCKDSLFTLEERTQICKEALKNHPFVEVENFRGLIVDFANKKNADFLVRGLRAMGDFEYELQQSLTNKKLSPNLETIFFMPDFRNLYLSSSIVRQVLMLGGELEEFVPKTVLKAIANKSNCKAST